MTDDDGTEIVTVIWYDSKLVALSTSFVGEEQTQEARGTARYRKSL